MFQKNNPLYFVLTSTLFMALMLTLLMGCRAELDSSFGVEVEELEDFKTVVAVDDNIFAVPTIIRYDTGSTLFVYDKGKGSVLEININGNIIDEYGRMGRGPGEFLQVNNIFLTNNYLYIVDTGQYVIHKYNRSGEVVSSFDYGKVVGLGRPNTPPPPFSPSSPNPENINNQPYVTQRGNVLVSSIQFRDSVQTVYELIDWKGNVISNIGEVPNESSFVIDYEQLRSDVSNREVPAIYRSNAFPVSDRANPEEYFLVYSAFPRVIKYNSSGQALWEREVPSVPEIESIRSYFFEAMERMQQSDHRNRIDLKFYVSGVSDSQGNPYLITNTNPPWIHQFNSTGKLIRRYKIVSNETDILPIFDINFIGREVFVVTEKGEVRAYQF